MCMRSPEEGQLLKLFGKKLAKVRRDKRITQSELAERLDMSVVAIAYIETGKRWVRIGTLYKIANALEVEVVELFRPS